ncbi:hypothetical protein AAG906_037243 [Vitis piasezkii]|uniref:VQ domain-containing protein n=1 Tax=Vitis vinifera TaxID=29760 RepID=A5AWV9_VITVI|nr:hypothetical protein VITISV_034276 [Vitis vinifera]
MASSDNLASVDPWVFRHTFADSWISEAFARDTETLTKALQKSISNHPDNVACDTISPFLNDLLKPETAQTPSVSGVSGSDHETAPKRRTAIPGAAGGKITKRKSRASKRSQTTFITADPANFRQMVQQVTGVRFGNSQLPVNPILKPEPKRPGNRLLGCLPTLDTSEFLLDHHHQQVMGPATATQGAMTFQPVVADGGATGLEFETFPSFPTLESWKVM